MVKDRGTFRHAHSEVAAGTGLLPMMTFRESVQDAALAQEVRAPQAERDVLRANGLRLRDQNAQLRGGQERLREILRKAYDGTERQPMRSASR